MIDSSPVSAESNFRELDDVFLQTQTRIWLGEVLNPRFDEYLHISDLLQDGEILFEVSKVVWNLLLTKCLELTHLKHKYGPFGSKKSSGRYRPYSNVDSFLKLCKILGLSGIDLFSPSDVVEKRNIRKVCICIRALSKKARSKLLSVPDFDIVVCSVTMPKDMVGVIKRNLESSQCTLSSSSSYSYKGSQTKLKQKNLSVPSNRDNNSSSEESDEVESRYMGENSFSSAGKVDDYADDGTADLSNSKFTLDHDGSIVGDSSYVNEGETNYISDYLAFSDLMVHAGDGSDMVIHDGKKHMLDFFLNVDKRSSRKRSCDDDDMEVSSTTSMSSVLGRLLNLEFDHHNNFDDDDSSSTNIDYSSVPKESEGDKHYNDSIITSESPKIDTLETPRGESCSSQTSISEHDCCSDKRDVVFEEEDISHVAEHGSQDTSKHSEYIVTESVSDEMKHRSPRLPPGKHGQKPLLKTVVKGTAIAGVLFLLLHIRKTKPNNAQETKPNAQVLKNNGSKSSSVKQRTGSMGKWIYPSDKIKLGN